jgi:serine/threonine protein kinase
MSSGTLPLATYHRAQALGSGTYGSVVAVYNDDGEEYALKLFLEDEDSDDEVEEDGGIDLGALREISILRLLRHDNGHENIVPMVDVKGPEMEGDEDYGAGTSGVHAMAMPLYKSGTLADAIDKGALRSCPKSGRATIAHGLLSAVAYLHDNGIMHRDIKSDNICLEMRDDGAWKPVLIDFSLAKVANGTIYRKGDNPFVLHETELTHTSEVGTVTYTAPEVVACEPYGLSSDLWSVGVILLEMVQNHTLEATKNKEGYKLIEQAKQKLPDQPFPNLVRRLLTVDPHERISARQALESPLFKKFGLDVPPVRLVDIHAALPLDEGDAFIENVKPTKNANKREKKNPLLVKRQKTIRMLCNELECGHPMTPYAAFVYSQQMYLQIDDTLDDLSQSQILLDCVVLASKFFEVEVRDLEELEEGTRSFKDWSLEEYYDNEGTIWMLMDHCLYPRGIGIEE